MSQPISIEKSQMASETSVASNKQQQPHEGSRTPPNERPHVVHPPSVLEVKDFAFGVKVSKTKATKMLIDGVSVTAKSGHLTALMGPSGSGKSTMLDLLSGRKASEAGTITLNGQPVSVKRMRDIASFVEQEDALLGVLTVRETITFALKLHLPGASTAFIRDRVATTITALGLDSCAETKIGNPIQRGVSGGQKRRVSVGCSMVCFPQILFLDEPTSGLDSTSAREVMAAIKRLAVQENMIVIASIHQPNWSTLREFDDILLLSQGQACYEGSVADLEGYLARFGLVVPKHITPTDIAMDVLNTDFQYGGKEHDAAVAEDRGGQARPDMATRLRAFYLTERSSHHTTDSTFHDMSDVKAISDKNSQAYGKLGGPRALYRHTWILSHRALLNYSRNVLAYGIRLAMYIGMAVMMATIWVQLGYSASTVNDRLSVHFYSVAFLAFMSVAGIPAFLEERAAFVKEHKNGLYGAVPFVLSNSIMNIPFLFICSAAFVVIMYWGIGLNPSAAAVFRYIGFLFLAMYAAECQVTLVSAVLPIFVAALAVTAFLNGFLMSLGGYFIKTVSLPHFWRVSFHWMDFQTYAFTLLSTSDLLGLTFVCEDNYCPYPSTIGNGNLSGEDVLVALGIDGISYAKYAGIILAIIAIYRLLFLAVLMFSGRPSREKRVKSKVFLSPA